MYIECHTELPTKKREEWDAFLTAAQHQHPRQDPRFTAVAIADGWQVLHVIGRVDHTICAVGMFSLRRHPFLRNAFAEAMCLSGPVCDNMHDLVAFLDTALHHPSFARIGRVKVTPYWMAEDAKKLHTVLADHGWAVSKTETFRQTGWVDITLTPEEIMARFSKSARREVRRAERQGVTLRVLTTESEALEFLDSLNRLRSSRGLGLIAQAGFITSFRSIYRDGDSGVILAAHHRDKFLAGLLLYRGKFTAHGRHFTTETDALRALGNLRISPILWLEGMKWARAKGCMHIDVEGYQENSQTSDAKYNIYKYKSEFGPIGILRISEHRKSINCLLDVTGNWKNILKATVRSGLPKGVGANFK